MIQAGEESSFELIKLRAAFFPNRDRLRWLQEHPQIPSTAFGPEFRSRVLAFFRDSLILDFAGLF